MDQTIIENGNNVESIVYKNRIKNSVQIFTDQINKKQLSNTIRNRRRLQIVSMRKPGSLELQQINAVICSAFGCDILKLTMTT